VILGLIPDQMRMMSRATGDLDLRAVLFAVAITFATCVTSGLLPALRLARVDPLDTLKQSSPARAGRRDDWWQGALISTQIALVIVLLAGAGLLLRSFVNLNQVDLGFNPDRLVLVELQLTQPLYSTPGAALTFIREVEARVETELGVPATIGTTPVRAGGISLGARPEAEGFVPPAGTRDLPLSRVSPDFFDVLQIPILAGRSFTAADGDTAVILNDVMAKRYFGSVSPIGKRFKIDTRQPWLTVVGVARDVKTMGPSDPIGEGMEAYLGYSTTPRTYNFLTLTAADDDNPDALAQRIRRIVWELDPRLPILTAMPLRDHVDQLIARPRFVLSLAGAFTICAVLIAVVGVYGVSAYWVTRRRRELAIRIAVGASPGRLFMSVLTRSLRHAAVGTAAGLLMALSGVRVIESLLFATDVRDPATFISVTLLLGMIAVAATAVPALNAARLDPATTLRAE
jgi:predicted permease